MELNIGYETEPFPSSGGTFARFSCTKRYKRLAPFFVISETWEFPLRSFWEPNNLTTCTVLILQPHRFVQVNDLSDSAQILSLLTFKPIGVDPSMFCHFISMLLVPFLVYVIVVELFCRIRLIESWLTFHHTLNFLFRIHYFQGFSIQFTSWRLGSPSPAFRRLLS